VSAPSAPSAPANVRPVFINALLTSLNIRELIFAAPETGAGLPRAPAFEGGGGKAPGLASELAVHVQTTTLHKVDDGYTPPARRTRRWKPEPAWVPMAVRDDGASATGSEGWGASPTVHSHELHQDVEARAL
jgi:hypothetical protein